ncbi:hypothetical protein EZJ43_09450 [Pedobacter changchengzhani]|uniref:FAS1 domain-containing protein n=1 Tax=Pedobacter changchengzhani TaxID=2529274 RepID=A0A4R5MKT3_9SPHI|nr:hypothetical protein [Pedobacter changchengzhani]TDG36218.1 hypothetical protein EZJ43_09450 [Pedobacter changchengzhani]
MKKNQYFIKTFTLCAMILFFAGCKKKSIYEDYVNTTQSFNGSAMAYLQAQPKGTFDSLLLVINRFPNLKDSLTNQKVTLFAPVDKSFQASIKYLNIQRKSEGKTPIYLSSASDVDLYFMVSQYIIRGVKTADDFSSKPDGADVVSISSNYTMHVDYRKLSASGFVGGGAASLDFSDSYGSLLRADWTTATTDAINIKTTNATINILSPLHNFGFDRFIYLLDK